MQLWPLRFLSVRHCQASCTNRRGLFWAIGHVLAARARLLLSALLRAAVGMSGSGDPPLASDEPNCPPDGSAVGTAVAASASEEPAGASDRSSTAAGGGGSDGDAAAVVGGGGDGGAAAAEPEAEPPPAARARPPKQAMFALLVVYVAWSIFSATHAGQARQRWADCASRESASRDTGVESIQQRCAHALYSLALLRIAFRLGAVDDMFDRYNGENYRGLQINPGVPSIEETLVKVRRSPPGVRASPARRRRGDRFVADCSARRPFVLIGGAVSFVCCDCHSICGFWCCCCRLLLQRLPPPPLRPPPS